ncbi:MAG: hypothetical protein KF784_02200 [Fimbriimonadaceae bacterium]|nr:hypothetical protein [Fimbriimonadaceae bacterium]
MVITGTILGVILVVGIIFSRLYKRASKERAFVRTGMLGQRVVMNGGAAILPVVQEVIEVNMNTMRLNVSRSNEQGLITKDRTRVDVQAEFFVRVKPTEDAIADAAQTLGNRTMHPEQLKELVEGKFVDALRAVAAELTMEELHEKRVEFVQRVQTTVSEDILKNGLELESVSLTALDQTSQDFLNPQNAFDAQGLAKLTEIIEAKRKQRNDIEQETRVAIEKKNLEAEKMSLELSRETEYARLEQEREVSMRRAQQSAEIATEQAARSQEAKQAEIEAQQKISLTDQAAKQKVEQQRIEIDRTVAEQEILKQRSVEAAVIEKSKQLELAEQDRAVAIAHKSKEKSEAEAIAADARAEAVRSEERVATARDIEVAERKKAIELVQASEEAEREAIKIKVAAQAEKTAALDLAAALTTAAEAEGEKARIAAQAAADAEMLKAMAQAKTYEVEASGKRAINEADNVINPAILEARIKQIMIENLPAIIRESVKPMEQIEGIKIIQVEGLSGGHSSGNGSSGDGVGGSLADQVVSSALRYRSQAPLVDSLMRELGLQPGDVNGLTKALISPNVGSNHQEPAPHSETKVEHKPEPKPQAPAKAPAQPKSE